MIEARKLCRSGQFTYRLYKATTDDEAMEQVDLFKKHYQKSVQIEDWGDITNDNLKTFANMCDDLAYQDLDLKLNDKFILVKEITTLKMDDDKKISNNKKFHKKLPLSEQWTDEQSTHLWRGTAAVVAKIVNKKEEQVEKERKRYINNNPGFNYPKECKKPRINAKVVIEKKPWVNSEIDVLWRYPPKQTALLMKRTVFEIAEKRKEICLQNPDFIIPASANFNKGDIPNKEEVIRKLQNVKLQNMEIQNIIEQRQSFWERNKFILWNNSAEEVQKTFNKTYHAVYQARLKFLERNKGFIIPIKSGFKMKEPYDKDKYDFTYEENVQHDVIPKNIQRLVAQDIETNKLQTIVTENSQINVQSEEDSSNLDKIAALLNKLVVKPKKITVGDITLEF